MVSPYIQGFIFETILKLPYLTAQINLAKNKMKHLNLTY